jgi:Protein of unknown function (DUF4007)
VGVFTQTFGIDRRAMADAISLLPGRPDLLNIRFYQSFTDSGHPLGVGWNKVESVAGWLRASGLITRGERSGERCLTALGELVMEFDPNLSKSITWWLLHIQLATNPEATVYLQVFALSSPHVNTKGELQKAINCQALGLTEASIDSDMSGVLSSFKSGGSKLATLGVLLNDDGTITRGIPEALTTGIVGNACYVVRERRNADAPSMALQPLCAGAGGLTAIFGLPIPSLRVPLRQLSTPLSRFGFSYSETADLDSITFGSLRSISLAERVYRGELRDDVIL